MKFSYEAVGRIPRQLEPGVIYHSEDFELASLLCACGCGHRVTLLVPDSHQVWEEGGMASVNPSIGVFDSACMSHYIIRSGEVQWLPAFSQVQANAIMHLQIARHVAQDAKRPWLRRFADKVIIVLKKIKAHFKIR